MTVNAICKTFVNIKFGKGYQHYIPGSKVQLEICPDGIRVHSVEFDTWSVAYDPYDLGKCFCSYEDWGKIHKPIQNILVVIDGKEHKLGDGYVTYGD